MNYNSLVTDMQTYMLRTDEPYVTKIPDMIEQGIIRIYNTAKDLGFELYYEAILNQNEFLIPKPVNWKETVSFSIILPDTSKVFLKERTYEYCLTYSPITGVLAQPKYYADSLVTNNSSAYENWIVSPSANMDYGINVIYLGVPLFNEGNPVNFLTQRYPNLLLYSCLIEACLFLDSEEKRNKYEDMFSKELDTINRMNVDRTMDRTVVRDRS